MADLFSLAKPLEEPDRSAFIKAATELVEKLGPDASGPGVVHRVLAPLWRQFFHPPSENQSRAYYNDGDDHGTRARARFARERVWPTDVGRQNRRRPVAGIRQLIE
jgi:hypothetical protein